MHEVRFLTPGDAERYRALRREMLLDAPWAFGSSPEDDRVNDPDFVRRAFENQWFAIAGGFRGGELIAAACVGREPRAKRRHIASITGVYVSPGSRGVGLGRAVVGACVARAREWPGVAALELSVSAASTAARRVYESLGFVAWGVEPDALRCADPGFGVRGHDEIHMRLEL